MVITYELIYNLVRQEKKNEALQPLDAQIHDQIVEYLQTKLQAYKSAPDKQKPEIKTQINNARRLVKELYDRRERKIINVALTKSRANTHDDQIMLPFEKKICNEVSTILNSYRKEVLLALLNAKTTAQKQEYGTRTLIRFTQPVSAFLNKQLKTLGPFKEGDIANLDSEIAQVIIDKNHAVELK